ncbi:MAG: lipase family protein [Stellaceae bacterium]
MISDIDCVQACADLYQGGAGFDALIEPDADDGVCVGLRRRGDDDLVIFRGSTTVEDWARDFLTIPHASTRHPQLGDVHAGFMLGMDDAFATLSPLLRPSVYVTGHSLGAARATLFCGLLVVAGRPPATRVVFGEPRSGCGSLTTILAGVPGRSYRNAGAGRHDLVTDVPTEPPFGRVTPLTDVFAPPLPGDPWGIFAYHHIQLYQAALVRAGVGVAA